MAAQSIWKVRPAARKLRTDPDSVIPAAQHPLDETVSKTSLAEFWTKWERKEHGKASTDLKEAEKYDFEDPLGATFGGDELDESVDRDVFHQSSKLRNISLDNTLENRRTERSTFDIELPDFQPWREKRARIVSLSKPKEFGMTQIEMLKSRLKMLADEKNLKNVKKAGDVSQKFLVHRENMISAWGRGDRVEAFKIVSESTRLLQSIPPYSEEYPYYWVLAVDVVDTFGKLVYDRLLSKSNEARNSNGQTDLPVNFSEEQVPKNVKDMATNWFLKLAEISDIPIRFYIECSMIACLKFFDENSVSINFERLAQMCSQFPDDLSSIFARVHVCRYSMLVEPQNRAPHWRVLHDWMQSPKDVMEDAHRTKTSLSEARKQAVSIEGIAWIVQCISHGAHTVEDLAPLFAYCRKQSCLDEKTFILNSAVVEGLPLRYLAIHSDQVLDIIFSLYSDYEDALTRLGKRYTQMAPIEENRKFVKNSSRSVWMRVADIEDFQSFIACCTAWSAYISKYYSLEDMNKIVDLVLVRLKIDDNTKKLENNAILVELVVTFLDFVAENDDCLKLVTSTDFIKIIDLIGYDIQSTSNCSQRILEVFSKRFKKYSISEYNACLFISEKCRSLCRRYGLEETEEVKVIEQLVCSSILLIDFQSISDPNLVIELIVRFREDMGLRQTVLNQVIQTLFDYTQFTEANLKPGKRKSDFMRVCITNLAITIPSIRDLTKRTRMTIQNIHMCLLTNFLPQIEISCQRVLEYFEGINDSLSSPCTVISPFVNQFLAVLCFTPDGFNQETPSLTHFSKLLQFVEKNHENWSKESGAVPLAEIYINMLRYLSSIRQTDFVAADQNVQNNDEEHLLRVDANISDVIAKLFSLANEPTIAVITLENVVMLFQVYEEMRSTIRGLLKRSVGASNQHQKRLEAVIQDLRSEAIVNDKVREVLQKLSLL